MNGRTIILSEITSFHPEISITIGWVPYQDQKLVRNRKNEWKMVKRQSDDKVEGRRRLFSSVIPDPEIHTAGYGYNQ